MNLPDEDWIIAAREADDNAGWCVACGEEAFGVEPDAANYECESRGQRQVFGAEELLIRGLYGKEVADADRSAA